MSPSPDLPPASGRALAVAVAAARIAGTVARERLGRVEDIRRKSARDVVTEVDHVAERLIIEEIRRSFPDDAILAEESGEQAARGGASATGGRGRVWIVDPLDGTVNYANGIPIFCVSVGLAVDGRPAVGAVLDPVRDELFTALRGHGARLDGRPIRNPDKEELADYVIGLGYPPHDWPSDFGPLRRSVRASRHLGTAALELCYAGAGRLDAFLLPSGMSNWDVAAAGLVAEEAGLRVTTLRGEEWFDLSRPPTSIGLLAAPPRHHDRLLGLFAASG